jgi:hypothetical protein
MTTLSFDHDAHRYTLDGAVLPSVTGILKAAGLIDFSGIPAAILEAARLRGSIVHQAIHYLNERDLDLDQFREDFPGYMGYLEAWISFCDQRRFTPVLNELRIASPSLRVAGTLDCLGLLDDGAVLLDFATGRPDDVAKDLQTAAYHGLALDWSEHDPALAEFFRAHPIVKRYAVALEKTGRFQLHPYDNPRDFRQFRTLVDAQAIVAARRGDRAEAAA